MTLIINIFLILIHILLKINALNITLNVSLNKSFNAPEYMGVGMGHSSIQGNWNKFFERLGINAARLFVDAGPNLRTVIYSKKWGLNLDAERVETREQFLNSIKQLQTPQARNFSANWSNPIKWDNIYASLRRETRPIYGSNDNTIRVLNDLNINTVLVQNIGCSKSATTLEFSSMDSSKPDYWTDRWELYKHSYALAVWAYERNIKMIEFYNEPDLELTECLNVDKFKDYYFIRSLSIQNAYEDCNRDKNNSQEINILASAFSRKTYGGDNTRYLGDICVLNNNYRYDLDLNDTQWSNMQMYSYHTYGKSGYEMLTDYEYIKESINNDTQKNMPIIITEHNSHTSTSWNEINSTADDAFEASRLASQIINLSQARIYAEIVFKFSITPSFSTSRDIAKNGLHWGDIYQEPYHISDTTLSAESVRLLAKMKQSTLYLLQSNDNSKFRTYLGSINSKEDPNFFYLYIVNDKNELVNLNINLTDLNVQISSDIFVEVVNSIYWGEIPFIINIPNTKEIKYTLMPYTTCRFTIQLGYQQNKISTNAVRSCSLHGGNLSHLNDCSGRFIQVGTSQTNQHENTNVAFLEFKLNSFRKNQKSLLQLKLDKIIGDSNSNSTLLILSVDNKSDYNESDISWSSLSNILNELSSSVIIDSIGKNFINWNGVDAVVGHVSIKKHYFNQTHLIDLSDYINKVINRGDDSIRLILYRPFRHEAYQGGIDQIPADDLSQGSIVSFYSTNSIHSPQLIHYWHQETNVSILSKASLSLLVYENSVCLNLSKLNINSIEPNTFSGINLVKTIYLDYNNLTVIYSGTFNNLTNLEKLYLNDNRISSIEPDSFKNLLKLEYLNLDNNQLHLIDSGMFTSMFNLVSLSLNYNKISAIESVGFFNLIKLEKLSLSHNSLTKVSLGLIDRLFKLKYLFIESNRLILIDVNAFNGLKELEFVCLYDNPISVFSGDSIQALCGSNLKCQVKTNEKCIA